MYIQPAMPAGMMWIEMWRGIMLCQQNASSPVWQLTFQRNVSSKKQACFSIKGCQSVSAVLIVLRSHSCKICTFNICVPVKCPQNMKSGPCFQISRTTPLYVNNLNIYIWIVNDSETKAFGGQLLHNIGLKCEIASWKWMQRTSSSNVWE